MDTFAVSEFADAARVESVVVAFARQLHVSPESIILVSQEHGTVVQEQHSSAVAIGRPVGVADALITNVPNLVLCVRVADCCGVVLYHQPTESVAVVHSGWRGTAKGVVTSAVNHMVDAFHAVPDELYAWLSPCASGDNYQVGADVRSVLGAFCRPDAEHGKWLYDNQAALRAELLANGLGSSNIVTNAECTITNPNYHSFRRDGKASGRAVVFAVIQR